MGDKCTCTVKENEYILVFSWEYCQSLMYLILAAKADASDFWFALIWAHFSQLSVGVALPSLASSDPQALRTLVMCTNRG